MKMGTRNNIAEDRKNAGHGDIFFAHYILPSGELRKSPVFVIGNDKDHMDIIIIGCTSQDARTNFDVEIQLKEKTLVRTNKIYTIGRDNLLFKIKDPLPTEKYNTILQKVKKALKLES
ncbi:hypothetical protein [Bacillus cereus group sp. BfR-BA-01324]|uniref:hypothetical protein n=1 Tax=Bacillus cereus group sp. BfR-BA-01324 TaxID=2920300 RepID=UPI001F587356|nr:hypothetical protein [Bacillus cereus group sp. BfR-BA-01324]